MSRVLIITGEASGDLHGANLAKALKALAPDVSVIGVGGGRMREAGVDLVPGIPQVDVIGMVGPTRVRAVARRILTLRRLLQREPLDLVVLIDQPGLNFHFARIAKRAGRRVVYYIAPQLWAWRPGRMRWMQRRVDHVVVILPFEAELYRRAGVPCTFVGHPLLDDMAPSYDREQIRAALGLPRDARVIGLLPGSRPGEVQAMLPLMLEAVRLLQRDCGPLRALLAVAETVNEEDIKRLCVGAGLDVGLVTRDPNGVMAASDLILAASGTATLQAAIIGTPMVIVYKLPWIPYLLGRLLVRGVQSIGLANIVAGRAFIPELIQRQATPVRLAAEARRILEDSPYQEAMRAEMARVRTLLGTPGASARAAAVVLRQLRPAEARA
ncbi:MAG TPA: lipid-A-disaccharide synthase [Nitrospirales bacterium]|nr:lipid-A-disaccharide synthase [Nitrospirales bacterium]